MTPLVGPVSENPVFNTGFKPSPVDHRDYLYRAIEAVSTDGLPEEYRCPQSLPVYDQGRVPKCVATSLALVKSEESEADLNELLLFDDDELYSHIAQPGGGANIRDGLEWIRVTGYKSTTDGHIYKIGSYAGVTPTDHEAVKHALFVQGILEGGFDVPQSFMRGGGKEFHAPPGGLNPNNTADPIVGGHAIALIGWTKIGPVLHNSWGAGWGEKGEITVSWDFFDTYFTELWTAFDAVVPKPVIVPVVGPVPQPAPVTPVTPVIPVPPGPGNPTVTTNFFQRLVRWFEHFFAMEVAA